MLLHCLKKVPSAFRKNTWRCSLGDDLHLFSSYPKLHFSVSSNASSSKPHRYDYKYILDNPTKLASLHGAKSLHAIILILGGASLPREVLLFAHNSILARYASLGGADMARKLFDEMPHRTVVSYNTLISRYSRDGLLMEALGLLVKMRMCGVNPTQHTLGALLSCHLLDLFMGMQLQALIEKNGLYYVDAFAGTALLGMYGRQLCLDEAIGVFESMPDKSLVTWNNMIYLLGKMGFIQDCILRLSQLRWTPLGISESTLLGVLSGLEGIGVWLGKQMHGLVMKYGFDRIASVSNCLINVYMRSGDAFSGLKFFEDAPVKDIVTWNTLIGAMANGDTPAEAISIFLKMCMAEMSPNEVTLINVLSSCSRLRSLPYGECIHAKIVKRRFEQDVFVGSALVHFYGQCDRMQEAHICFECIAQKNTVAWNSLMLGYINRGSSFSVQLLKEMTHSDLRPNEKSFSIVMKTSPRIELQQLHSLMIKMGYHENAYVLSSIISSYARNGLVSEALIFVGPGNARLPVVASNIIAWIYNQSGQYEKTQELYASLDNPDTVSWNILIAACSRNGDYKETFDLFYHMRGSQVHPDCYTYVSLFSVCTQMCNLALGSSLHGLIVKINTKLCDTFVCNTMIDMYGKCGSVDNAVKVFNDMEKKNVISWTALLSALGLHGYAGEALKRFGEMEMSDIRPDKVTFLAILSACRHVGLVKQGMNLFNQMKLKYGIKPEIDHYVIVVDLLTRYVHIKEAEQLILGMPIAPNALVWRSFFEGCKKHSTYSSHAIAA